MPVSHLRFYRITSVFSDQKRGTATWDYGKGSASATAVLFL